MKSKDWRDGLYIAQPKDWEKIKKIISPYEQDIFPHLGDKYWQHQLDQGNVSYDNTGCIYVANIIPDERDFEGYVELHKGELWIRQTAVAENLRGTGIHLDFTKKISSHFARHNKAYCLIVESNIPVTKLLKKRDFKLFCKYKKFGQIWMKDYNELRKQRLEQKNTKDGSSVAPQP